MCHVKSKDFEFVVATDIDKKKLFNSTIFARRPVSLNSCYQLLAICASFVYVYMFNNYFSFWLLMFLQFLPFSSTPYAQTVQPPETGETGEDVEVNPSASLNEWLVPGFPNSQELEVTNISKFVSCIRLLF
jgi:hypothetical protein